MAILMAWDIFRKAYSHCYLACSPLLAQINLIEAHQPTPGVLDCVCGFRGSFLWLF